MPQTWHRTHVRIRHMDDWRPVACASLWTGSAPCRLPSPDAEVAISWRRPPTAIVGHWSVTVWHYCQPTDTKNNTRRRTFQVISATNHSPIGNPFLEFLPGYAFRAHNHFWPVVCLNGQLYAGSCRLPRVNVPIRVLCPSVALPSLTFLCFIYSWLAPKVRLVH